MVDLFGFSMEFVIEVEIVGVSFEVGCLGLIDWLMLLVMVFMSTERDCVSWLVVLVKSSVDVWMILQRDLSL